MKKVKRLIILNTVLVGGYTLVPLLSDTIYLESWQKTTELTREGTPVPLPKKLHELVNTVTSEMRLKRENKSLIKPYLTKGVDVVHYGYAGPGSATGAILGIPQNFLLDSDLPINFSSAVNDVTLPTESRESQDLKNALFLSEDAMKFAIAHQIYEATHPSYYLMAAFPLVLIIIINSLFLWNVRSNSAKLNKTNSIFQSQVIVFGIGLYFIVVDLVSVYREAEADFKAAKIGKSYLGAGIEFYEKMIERNKLLKKLDKNAPYMEDGDININWLRTTHMSLLRRVTYLNDLKNAAEKNQKAPNIWKYVYLKEILQK